VSTPQEEPGSLDYLSFVDFAVAETTARLPQVDPVAMRLVLALHRVASTLVYDVESSVHRPHGWSWAGFRVVFVLWLVGPCDAKTVAALSGMSRSAVSALVNTLERNGVAKRSPSPEDARAVQLELTERGQAAIASTFVEHNAREQAWAGSLSKPEQLVLIGLLEKLATGSAARAAVKRT
jgi:DNA-binding MarR family transcriptional regulator